MGCCLLARYMVLKAWKNDYQAADKTPRWESAGGALERTLVERKEGLVRYLEELIAVWSTGECKNGINIEMDG